MTSLGETNKFSPKRFGTVLCSSTSFSPWNSKSSFRSVSIHFALFPYLTRTNASLFAPMIIAIYHVCSLSLKTLQTLPFAYFEELFSSNLISNFERVVWTSSEGIYLNMTTVSCPKSLKTLFHGRISHFNEQLLRLKMLYSCQNQQFC